MKIRRRIMAIMLAVVMVFGAMPLTGINFADLITTHASALASTGQCGDNVYWTFNSTTGLLTISGSGNMRDYDIEHCSPFSSNRSIKTVVIENGVTSIGSFAFSGCTGLKELTMPCSAKIGYGSFSDCTNIEKVTLTKGTGIIDDNSFFDNPWYISRESIKEIVLEDGITNIGRSAFMECTDLTSITIPDSVTSIGDAAFAGCTGLTKVYINNVESWCKINFLGYGSNPLFYAHNLYLNNILVTELVIPDSITRIGDYAFHACTSLTSVTIPNSVTSIGNYAFRDCTGLTSITIPDGVTSIGDCAFEGCTGLKKLTYNVTNCTSGSYAFRDSGIETITVSSNVESIPDRLFAGMPNLSNVIFESDDYIKIGNAVFDASYNAVICCKENSYMHHYAKEQGLKYCIIDDDSNPSFTVKNDVLSKYSGADSNLFVSCASEIGYGAFADNKNVQTIELSGNVTRIYNKAFANCSNLEKIIIPQSVASIGDNAFSGCSKLTIWCYAGSYAESFAKAHNIKIQYITLSVSESKVNMLSSETVQLTASFNTSLLENDELVWTSDNPNVVTVTPDGKITAFGNGEATITATSKTGLYATCKVIVDMPSAGTAGDVDGDGKINSSDALLVLQHSVQQITLTAEQQTLADVNKDSKINSSDALLILQYTVGKITKF